MWARLRSVRRGWYSNIVLLVLLAIGGIGVAVAAKWPEIEYGYPEQAPRAFTNSKGEPDGHYPRLLGVLFQRAGVPWHGASFPAKRLMVNLDNGSTQFSILVKNPLLDKCCLYGKAPVWYDELRAYAIGDKPALRSREDLKGKRIITLAGFSYGGLIDFINEPANEVWNNPTNSRDAAFDMLEAGRADYLLDYAEAAQAQRLNQRPITNLRSSVLETVHMYFVINRDYPDAAGLLQLMEKLYQSLRQEDVRRVYTK